MITELYNVFDKPFDRKNTFSIKWDECANFGNADALPMWVADMDFPTAKCVIDGLNERTVHGAFGYTAGEDLDKAALIGWYSRRHDAYFEKDDILFSPGVVDSIYHCLKALYNDGDKIVIQPPVYGPFRGMVEKAKMQVVENPLVCGEDGWKMDLEDLEEKFRDGAKAIVMCSPANPVGRVWKRDELEAVTALCEKYSVQIICDEIHADFELDKNRHTCIISCKGGENAIQLVSATKSFNLAALRHSAIICKNSVIREKIKARLNEVMCDVNLYGRLATRLAYEGGDEWMTALNMYITDNRNTLERNLRETGLMKPARVEGTYLMWVDCGEMGLDDKELNEFFVKKAAVIPTEGTFFGTQGSGFVRFNMATRRTNIDMAIERIRAALNR